MLLLAICFAWWGAKVRKKSHIDNAVRLIAASPILFGSDHDPMALVRAVNSLHALGKNEAIEALRLFAAQHSAETYKSPMLFIIPLLFDHADPEDRFGWERSDEHKAFWHTTYCSNCFIAEDDIPFRYRPTHLWGTRPDNNLVPAIKWAEKHGRMRTTPLHPADNPLAAVDMLLDRRFSSSSFADLQTNRKFLREQAFRMVEPHLSSDFPRDVQLNLENDDDWKRLQQTVEKLGLRWSETHQAHICLPATPR